MKQKRTVEELEAFLKNGYRNCFGSGQYGAYTLASAEYRALVGDAKIDEFFEKMESEYAATLTEKK